MPTSEVIDYANDTTRADLCHIAEVYSLPEFVKRASFEDLEPPSRRNAAAYADPINLKFACHNAAATWLSSRYFDMQKEKYTEQERAEVSRRLEKFAEFFGIQEDIRIDHEKHATTDDLPETEYAYVWVGDNGERQCFYPLTSAMEVKKAADWLLRVRDHMILADRSAVASRVLEKAADFGVSFTEEMSTYLERQIGHGIPDMRKIAGLLTDRRNRARDPITRTAIDNLTRAVESTPSMFLQPADAMKLACTIEEVDAAMNIRYDEKTDRPEDVIFETTFSKISKDMYSLCELQTGSVYEKDQFAKLSRDEITNLLGKDHVDEVWSGLNMNTEKFAEIASTLPRPDAEVLEQLLAEQGEVARRQKFASFSSLPTNELERMAVNFASQLAKKLGEPKVTTLS